MEPRNVSVVATGGETSSADHTTDGQKGDGLDRQEPSGIIRPPEKMTESLQLNMNEAGLGVVENPGRDEVSVLPDSVPPNKSRSGLINAFRILFELDSYLRTRSFKGGAVSSDSEEKSLTEHDKVWAEYMRNNADIGIVTLAKYHHSENFYLMYYFKTMLMAMLLAQWLIPIILSYKASITFITLGWGLCPNNAPASTRTQTFAIGIVYISKISFLVATKLKEMYSTSLLNETRQGGEIQLYVAMDRFMNLFYEVLVYLVNMWIIYTTLDPLEIVFNALAIEFVVILDDEIKEFYLLLFPPEKYETCLDALKDANNENGRNPIKRWQFFLVRIIFHLNLWSIPVFLVGLFALFFFSLVCKPGEGE